MRRVAVGIVLAVAGALMAAPALGDATITAGPVPDTFTTSDVTIDQGQAITFQNSDTAFAHDVTADATVGGKPLFKSDLIEGGKTSPVRGVEFLKTGDYTFHCSVHSFMTGTIHVTANGTPKTPTPANPAPSPDDTTPPDASVSILDSRISGVLAHRGVRVRLSTSEPARFKLVASSGKTRIALATVVAQRRLTTKMALTKKGKRYLFTANKVRLKLTAQVNDAADNRSAATATRTLR